MYLDEQHKSHDGVFNSKRVSRHKGMSTANEGLQPGAEKGRTSAGLRICSCIPGYLEVSKFKFKFCSFFATASMQQLFALQHHPNSSVHEVLECLFFKKDMKFWWSSRSAINHALTRLSSSFLPHPHGYLPPLSLGSCTNIDCVSSDTSALCSLSFCDYHQRVFISSCSYCPKDYPYNWYEWRWEGEREKGW